jgi:hypothetical protein
MSCFSLMLLYVVCGFTVLSVHIFQNKRGFNTDDVSVYSCLVSLDAIGAVCVYTGLFKMIVGVLTTCHTQYT